MKQCPKCQTTYADDNLQFCLQDGARLDDLTAAETVHFESEPETVVSPKRVEPIRFDVPSSYPNAAPPSWEQSQPVIVEQPAKKPNTAMVVALSVLGTIALLGLGGLGAWLYFNNQKTEVAVNVNAAAPNRTANQNANNAAPASPSPTPSPTAQPTLRPEETKAITKDVQNALDEWRATTENAEVDAHIARYADTVDYYKAGRVNVARVRADRQSAFDAYGFLSVNLDNVKVTPDASGEKATVVLDKEWNFEGREKFSSGKVQQQLTLGKINGKWLITGEKDLKIYYVNKSE